MNHEPFRGWPADQRVNPAVPVVPMETGRDVDFYVHIGCTDQHRHKPVILAAAIRELDGELHMSRALEWYAPPAGPNAERGFNRSAYRFNCPRCPRNPQINRDDWWNLVFRLVLAGRNKLDISRLS